MKDDGVVVTIIGCGSPHPAPSRLGTSVAIEAGDDRVLVDAGPGTLYKMLQHGLDPTGIDALLLTHHHFDHTGGVPSFLLTRWESSLGREKPLYVAGPSGTMTFIDRLVGPEGAYRPDIVARREAPLTHAKIRWLGGTLPRADLETDVHEFHAEENFTLPSGWKVATGHATHVEPWHESIGFRVEIGDVSVCVTGDSGRTDSLVNLARDVDLLVIMCCEQESELKRKGLDFGQMGTVSAATLARDAGARAMVMTHTNTRVERSPHRERAVHEIAGIFSGDVYFSEEGLRIPLG